MKHEISSNRKTLTVTFDDADRQALRELPPEGERGNIQTDIAMIDALEPLTCNSELEWVDPSETGDLTSAPMLGIRNELGSVSERWAFLDYQLRSPLVDLLETGKAVFTC